MSKFIYTEKTIEVCESEEEKKIITEVVEHLASKKPSEKEYLSKMAECEKMDEESGHITADAILCALLTELGYAKLVEAYEELPKWFA